MIEDTDGIVRWEYHMITTSSITYDLTEILNAWGRESWEVISTEFYKTDYTPLIQVRVLFKRPYYMSLSQLAAAPAETTDNTTPQDE